MFKERVYNFAAGPSAMPEEVLKIAQGEMLNYKGTGMSVMEMSHRSAAFEEIIGHAKNTLRELMEVPEDYEIMFVQGGGSTQFAMIPLNLMTTYKRAFFLKTGQWAKKAIAEAKIYGEAEVVASSEEDVFTYIPKTTAADYKGDADYAYICYNNTIYGTHFTEDKLPDVKVPLVTDISSCILGEKVDVRRFGLLFAGAQKNLGPAGVTVVIMKKDLIGNAMPITPTMLNYKTHADNDSLYNTPPTYGIYMLGLVLDWVKERGGVEELEKVNRKKAALLYDYLDNSKLFKGTVVKEDRSIMNVPFVLPTDDLNKKFIAEATEAGMVELKGHRTVGGMRASIYNATPYEGVVKLVDFMEDFEKKNA